MQENGDRIAPQGCDGEQELHDAGVLQLQEQVEVEQLRVDSGHAQKNEPSYQTGINTIAISVEGVVKPDSMDYLRCSQLPYSYYWHKVADSVIRDPVKRLALYLI